MRAAGLALGALRLLLAAAIILAAAYALSWQLLWQGMAGSEAPFHLHLISWVASTFPNLPWWYPWDGMGVSYRDAYPLASHWLAVAISRAVGTTLEEGAQVVQFSLMPITAVGVYAFFDWRIRRPLAGIVAAILFLLSPIGWVEWTHFGLYASWVGMTLFMPALIALDVFFGEWCQMRRGWPFRLGAAGYVAFTTLLGIVSPHLLAAPLIAAAFYVFALPRGAAGRAWGWLSKVMPALVAGVILLSAFWLAGELQYLGVVRSHWPGAGTNFDPGRLMTIDIADLLSLHPLRDGNLGDLYSLSPAVLLPALVGLPLMRVSGRARVLTALCVLGIVMLPFKDIYRPFFAIPGFAEFAVVAHRPIQLLLAVAAPSLAALGLFELPRVVVGWVATRRRWPRRATLAIAAVLPVILVLVLGADVLAFAAHVDSPGRIAYGPSVDGAPSLHDLVSRPSPGVGCDAACLRKEQSLARLGMTFPSPPARAELNSDAAQLDMAFHTIVGGGITHSYNDQVIPSRELASWMEQSMLDDSGVTVKTQLAQALGIDAVVLSTAQSARVADYTEMGWQQVSTSPIALVNPQPSGLGTQWDGGTAVLVIGETQTSTPALYNFVFERATSGVIPFDTAWLVRGASPYIDDYSAAELNRYAGVIVLGYQYRDQGAAWGRLDGYARAGGRLFIETGWQYVDPDWNVGPTPAFLPVPSLRWGALDPSATPIVDGSPDPGFGALTYGAGGWGASSAPSVRPGATELVRVGGRVVAASWDVGRGQVLWSGMNLLAHEATSHSTDEDAFVASQFRSLFATGAGTQARLDPQWNASGDQARLALHASSGRTVILFKESLFPGWSATLETPNGSQSVALASGEMDFMLATLDSVPAGSSLVFHYGPTAAEQASWGVSALFLVALALWTIKPALYARARKRAGLWIRRRLARFEAREDDEDDAPATHPPESAVLR